MCGITGGMPGCTDPMPGGITGGVAEACGTWGAWAASSC